MGGQHSEALFKPTHGTWEEKLKAHVCSLWKRNLVTVIFQCLCHNISCSNTVSEYSVSISFSTCNSYTFYFIHILLRISSNFFCVLRGFPFTAVLKYKIHFEFLSLNTKKWKIWEKNKQINRKKGRKVKWLLMNLLAILCMS